MKQQDSRQAGQTPGMGARPEDGDYAGQQQAGGQYGDAGQEQGSAGSTSVRPPAEQTFKPETSELSTGQASYGNSGESVPSGSDEGQSPASETGETMSNAPRRSEKSTRAQRSGGQSEDGVGSNDASFQGSSFGGQTNLDR